jgi:Cof subfamily protein (haloacid dehalogenase superfamily)
LSSKTIKLIASDLDGTLLDSSGKIPERNKEAVARASRLGVVFIISTGRMFSSARTFASELGLTGVPLICYNGALVKRGDGETMIHSRLDMGLARSLLAFFRERGTYVQSYVDDVLYIKECEDGYYQNYTTHFGVTGTAVGDALYEPETPPTKLLATTSGIEETHKLVRELSEMYGDKLYVTSSNMDFVEMMNPEAGKGKCLRKLAGIMGVEMENVMALGDGENDSEMVSYAGMGIAMANARKRTKDAAKDIAPSNDECGVAWAIEKYVL